MGEGKKLVAPPIQVTSLRPLPEHGSPLLSRDFRTSLSTKINEHNLKSTMKLNDRNGGGGEEENDHLSACLLHKDGFPK